GPFRQHRCPQPPIEANLAQRAFQNMSYCTRAAKRGDAVMFKKILVPVDLADTDLAKPAIDTALEMARASGGSIRLVNVLAMTPVMLAEYVPPDFDVQQRKSAE